MATGLFIGRFQPFHLGHQKAIEWMAARNRGLIIGVGSSQASSTPENPFSFDERKRMITSSLRLPADEYAVIGVPDINDPPNWVAHVESLAPRFDVVYSNAPLDRGLFNRAGYAVVEPPFFSRKTYAATEVRRRMAEGGDWRKLVPDGTRQVIEDVGGVARVKKLGV